MEAALLYPSKYIKSQELKGKDTTLTIATVQLVDLERDDNTTEKRGVITFKEAEKAFILNKTNLLCIKAMLGNETDLWIGKRITLYPIPYKDSFTGEMTTATRVRGSPDIAGPVSVSVKLKKRKAQTMTMQRTGGAAAPTQRAAVPLDGDQLADEIMNLRLALSATNSRDEMKKAWAGGMSARVARLPQADREAFNAEFSAHGKALDTAATPPAEDSTPMPA